MRGIEGGITGIVCEEDEGWFVFNRYKAFGRINLADGQITEINSIPEESGKESYFLFGTIAKCGEYLIFPPVNAACILVCHLPSQNYKMIPLKTEKDEKGNNLSFQFYNSCVYGKKVFLFSNTYPAIVTVEVGTWEISCLYDPICAVRRAGSTGVSLMTNYCRSGHSVYLCAGSTNHVLELNADTNACRLIELGKSGEYYTAPACDGENLWVMLRSHGADKLVKHRLRDGETEYYDLNRIFGADLSCKNYIYSACFRDKIYFIPSLCDGYIICVDRVSGKVATGLGNRQQGRTSGFSSAWKSGNRLYLCDPKREILIEYDMETGRYAERKIDIADSQMDYFKLLRINDNIKKGKVLSESADQSLLSYIKAVAGGSRRPERRQQEEQTAGERIYKKMKELEANVE